ncbi:MAG TPA: serine hydrolase domain-containing protein [Candidatus Angelobacter sp.]
MITHSLRLFALTLLCLVDCGLAQSLPAEQVAAIDKVANTVLNETGVPSAVVGIVKDGKIVFAQGYGNGRLDPAVPANRQMRYSIGSISKQFTAAAVLLLQEEKKLSLDDPVAKYFPSLTRAGEVSIRELLSHTSGYQDYYPQDYVPLFMVHPTTAQHIMDTWAKKPLDFDPGTRWQYSNTNYVIAGAIVEKITGHPLFDFLKKKIFDPLGMKTVIDTDQGGLGSSDAVGYFRYASGPAHPETKEGPGWLSAVGELSMTVEDLLRWDISLMNQTVFKPESYRQLETDVHLKNGVSTRYALGLSVFNFDNHHILQHDGEVTGFTANNVVLPEEHIAIAVLTNQMASGASGGIARQILSKLFESDTQQEDAATASARRILEGLQKGTLDRSLFTEDANQFFTQAALNDYRSSLGPLGPPKSFTARSKSLRGGMVFRSFTAAFELRVFVVTTFEQPDGKLEQYLVVPREQ